MQISTRAPLDTSRGSRLEARVSLEQKTELQKAATLSGRTLSDFVVASAHEAARRIIRENETIQLSRADQVAFVNALINPPEPNARLRRAAESYRKKIGQ